LALGLDPCFTRSVESPESNGMAEAFVKISKRDYVRANPIPDAASALAAIPDWIDDYNEIHPHSWLGYRSPREYLRANLNTPRVGLTGEHSRRHNGGMVVGDGAPAWWQLKSDWMAG
jgi:transposase InsO family protein